MVSIRNDIEEKLKDFRFDLMMSSLEREATRIYEAPHLTPLEQETYCRMIQITRALVINAAAWPLSRGTHLSDETHLELRAMLRRVEAERWDLNQAAGARGGMRYPLICDQSGEVADFPAQTD